MGWQVFDDRPLAAKLTVITAIILGLMIPLSLLRGLIAERSTMRAQAVETVAKGWGGSLRFGGLVLKIPFDVERKLLNGEISVDAHHLYVLADSLNVEATLDHTITRKVGIYGVPVYLVHAKLNGSFKMSDVIAAATLATYPNATFRWKDATVRLPVSDVRSIREVSLATLDKRAMTFGPSAGSGPPGVESKIDLSDFLHESSLTFTLDMVLAGSQSISFLPTAAVTKTDLQAGWPDPQFQGSFLPSQYAIETNGFKAQWQVLALNRSFPQSWVDAQIDAAALAESAYGTELFQAVDVYQRSERAVKYALVFIALTFLSFFSWECVARLQIHAMQYLFIGLALSTFYLLLIALSEHLPFWMSFWLAAGALVTLIGVYIAGALERIRFGAIVACVMTLVYGLLYMLVLSESNSLLMGAIALFGVLATIMITTRRIRWGL
jgi:inner membrane protein